MLVLINNVELQMKNNSSSKNVQSDNNHQLPYPRIKFTQKQSEASVRVDLKIKIPQPNNDNSKMIFKTKQSESKSKQKQQESTQLLLTERTNKVNEFVLPSKQMIQKGSNIKSYLRVKPTKPTSYHPLQIFNSQNIVHERTTYKFDWIFQPQTAQSTIYEVVGKEVTSNFLQGYNGTIFAYGNTGSGKTYTMFGNDDGVVPSVVDEIFTKKSPNAKISCSMIEIYKQNLIDLLSNSDSEVQLKIKQINNNCYVQNLSIHETKTKQEALQLIKKGNILKKIRQTDLNESSSRSHIVVTFYLDTIDLEGRPIKCKFNLVDLAGSEKVFKSKVQGEGLQQAKKINLSLSCLGNTISALVRNSDHIPYRESKLTRILKESLMGNSITRLIVTCCLSQQLTQQTISSIKFAQRAQKVQTQAVIAYNINKFKGEKQERQKYICKAYDQVEVTLNKISALIVRQPCQCSNCKQITAILNSHIEPNVVFNFSSLNPYKSPKHTDVKGYFSSNSVEKFSSVQKGENRKNSVLKNNSLSSKDDKFTQIRQVFNKRIFDLKSQNDRLALQKQKLELKVKILQQKIAQLEKQQKMTNKKIIKLGQANERPSKSNKQNIMANSNPTQKARLNKKQLRQNPAKFHQESKIPYIEVQHKQQNKQLSKQSCLDLTSQKIEQLVLRLEIAAKEYTRQVYPNYLQILNEQVIFLQSRTIQIKKPYEQFSILAKYFQTLFKLQRKFCHFIDQIPEYLFKLFELSSCEYKQQLSSNLHEKIKEISDIQWNMKQFCEDYSQQLQQITMLLTQTKQLPNDKMESNINVAGSRISITSMISENQFLKMNPLTFHPILISAQNKF